MKYEKILFCGGDAIGFVNSLLRFGLEAKGKSHFFHRVQNRTDGVFLVVLLKLVPHGSAIMPRRIQLEGNLSSGLDKSQAMDLSIDLFDHVGAHRPMKGKGLLGLCRQPIRLCFGGLLQDDCRHDSSV